MLFGGNGMFRKEIDPKCAYCKRGSQISEREVACVKRGIVPVEDHCRAFRYDPLKRTPPRPAVLKLGRLTEQDFSLDAPLEGQITFTALAGLVDSADSAAEPPEEAGPDSETPENPGPESE